MRSPTTGYTLDWLWRYIARRFIHFVHEPYFTPGDLLLGMLSVTHAISPIRIGLFNNSG
jgi:hypothetical protein